MAMIKMPMLTIYTGDSSDVAVPIYDCTLEAVAGRHGVVLHDLIRRLVGTLFTPLFPVL